MHRNMRKRTDLKMQLPACLPQACLLQMLKPGGTLDMMYDTAESSKCLFVLRAMGTQYTSVRF